MKRTAITGLFLSAALLASPVFAAESLCDTNLQKLDDQMASAAAMPEDMSMKLKEQADDARAAKAAGNEKDCITLTTKALEDLEKNTKGGGSQ